MRPLYYKLDGKNPITCDMHEMGIAMENNEDRCVANDTINNTKISTVFLCIDHQHADGGPPILFETMIFGGQFDGYMQRYSTWEEAKAGHRSAAEFVFDATTCKPKEKEPKEKPKEDIRCIGFGKSERLLDI